MATFKYIDENGRPQTIAGVLDSVALTGVSSTSGSNILTCASTTGVYPLMPVSAPNFPLGVFVGAVKSATELELWLSIFNRTTGVWSTTAANANATANGSSLLARAHGYSPACIIEEAFAMGAWRNLHNFAANIGATVGSVSGTLTDGSAAYAGRGFGAGMAVLPTAGTLSSGTLTISAVEYLKSDHLVATPLKRHNGELWGVRPLVCTGGHVSHVPAHPRTAVLYTGA